MKNRFLIFIMVWGIMCILTGCSGRTVEIEKEVEPKSFIEEPNYLGEQQLEDESKLIPEYTWEEFEGLSSDQQEAFFEGFETSEAFDEWMIRVNPDEVLEDKTILVEKPWENNGKSIGEYTWEEFEGLSGDQQEAFFEAFETAEAFEAWITEVQP